MGQVRFWSKVSAVQEDLTNKSGRDAQALRAVMISRQHVTAGAVVAASSALEGSLLGGLV